MRITEELEKTLERAYTEAKARRQGHEVWYFRYRRR